MNKIKTIFISFMTTTLSMLLIFLTVFGIVINVDYGATLPTQITITKSVSTSAAEASLAEKGGFSYVGSGSNQTINGGRIKGYSRKYGGAFYVAEGGVLTINNVTITECTARYGGAIYIENGGTVRIHGGSITNNGALYAPAIFVEDGGVLELDGTTIIEDNIIDDFFPVFDISNISQDTIMVGHATNGVQMHYIEFGTYPRTYVTEESCGVSQETLTSWLETEQPEIVKSYVVGDSDNVAKRTWNAYRYTDGNIYAYGTSIVNDVTYTYADGNPVVETGNNAWFKVEPIKWVVLNYDAVIAGTAQTLDVLSYEVIASNVRFYPNNSDEDCNKWYKSSIREWLNDQFLNSAFTDDEVAVIHTSKVLNNVTGNYSNSTSDGTGVTTKDKVYLRSYWESSNSNANNILNNNNKRLVSPSDFALSNRAYMYVNASYTTALRPQSRPGTSYYWLRSAGHAPHAACNVYDNGVVDVSFANKYNIGARPALSLNYK